MTWTEISTWIGHWLSGAAVLATLIGLLPPLVAVVGLFWYGIQIYESRTMQTYMAARRSRKIAKLQAAIANLQVKDKIAQVQKAAAAESEKKVVEVIKSTGA